MAAPNSKTTKRGILRLTRVFRDAPAESSPAPEAASPQEAAAAAAVPDGAGPVGAAPEMSEDTIQGLRRLTDPGAAEIGPEERAAAVRRIEDEIHQRLARWLRLEDELRTAGREIQRLEAANDASRVAITALEAQAAVLAPERDAALARAAKLQAELDGLRQQASAGGALHQSLEQQLAEAREAGDRHGQLRAEAEARAEALRTELQSHRDALAGLQLSLDELQMLVAQGESQKALLASRAHELEDALADARSRQLADRQARDELWASLAELQQEARTAEESRARAAGHERDLSALRSRLVELERHNAELVADLQAARSGLEGVLRERTAALAEQLAAAEARGAEAATSLAVLRSDVAAVTVERDTLLEALADRDARLAQRAREIEALEQAGAQLLVERDAQSRTIQELHAQLRTHKKLVRVLGNGMGGVNEVAATIRSLDDWVSHQLEAPAAGATEPLATGLRHGRVLEALGGPRATRYALDKTVFTIGRSADSDMRVGGPYTSRHHARILSEGPEVIIEDLGSANGLLVNDQRVARCVLRDGDVLDIGGSRFRFLDQPGAVPAVALG